MTERSPSLPRTALDEKNNLIRLDKDAFTLPAVGIQDAPNRCYRLNNEWAKIIMGFVSLLTETRGWDGAVYDDHPGIIGVMEFLVGEECGMIDCADIEACLQTSFIINQIVAVTYATQEAATQTHIDELNTAYDGTPQSVGSEIPLTAPDANSLDQNALCRTLELLVSVYANGKGISLDLLSDFGTFYQDMVAAMRGLFGFAPNWLMHALGSELGGCAPDVASAKTALADTDAQLEFACCLYDEMRVAVISETGWNTAVSNCAGSLTGNAGTIACLMEFDNNVDHALAFFEVYSRLLERQAAGEDFVCLCVPDGWFWQDVLWDWEAATHGGSASSPVFSHTNPSNGELFCITARHQSDTPSASNLRPVDTALPDSLLIGNPLTVGTGLRLWENPFVGLWEGRDAIGWPAAQSKSVGLVGALRQPNATFTMQWAHAANQGNTASVTVSLVRLLYKEV